MHEKTYSDIIAQTTNGYVSRCSCCEEFNVTYKNVLLVFNEESMWRFFEWIIFHRSVRDNFQLLPNGRNRIYSSPHSNLYLVYTDSELDELNRLFVESRLIIEARKMTCGGSEASGKMNYPEEGR